MKRPRQPAASSAPGKSKACVALGVRGNVFRPIRIATSPNGMLTPNSQPQGPTARMREAIVGPSVKAVATTIALYPKPRPCRRPGKTKRTSAVLTLMMPLAPRPCSTRAISRLGNDQASAQASDASVNSKRPPR